MPSDFKSHSDLKSHEPKEPFKPNQARKILSERYVKNLYFSRHALDEMAKDRMTEVDATNVVRGGKVSEPPDFEKGTYRYRVHTVKMCVVVAFGPDEVRVVTAWRKTETKP